MELQTLYVDQYINMQQRQHTGSVTPCSPVYIYTAAAAAATTFIATAAILMPERCWKLPSMLPEREHTQSKKMYSGSIAILARARKLILHTLAADNYAIVRQQESCSIQHKPICDWPVHTVYSTTPH
eukprot:18730-Heterococcus_DN1.PRE.1